MKKSTLLLAVLGTILCLSCSKQPSSGEEDIKFTMTKGSLGSDAAYFFIGVQAEETSDWTLSLDFGDSESWASLTETAGSGCGTVRCDYQANNSKAARLMTITLKGGATEVTYAISQSGNEPASTVHNWMELPAVAQKDKDKCYSCSFNKSYVTYRNYSILWSAKYKLSLWVAYPLNDFYMKGSTGRTNAWGYDPSVPTDEQACLYRGYRWPASRQTDRGHQLPSADRLCCTEANAQTFYFTNMTPQYDDFNTGIWSTMESRVRACAAKSDTLYVVTGVIMGNSPAYAYDNNGEACAVPDYYYKALLSYNKNTSYGFSGWQAACFLFNQNNFASATLKGSSMSVRTLESRLGMDLFVNLKELIGDELYDKVEQQNPVENTFWW